jgi:hypothetical protein
MQANSTTPEQAAASKGAAGREYLRTVGQVCTHVADSGDDRELRALVRTLEELPELLQRRGLLQPGCGRKPWR